tara:strand:- start:4933 stop:5160 length:228 start_codon:yes stop_codon:yes gene_type:complete
MRSGAMSKKEIIEKLKSIEYEVECILEEALDAFNFELLEFRKDPEPDYFMLSNLALKVYQAQRVQKVILEIIGKE